MPTGRSSYSVERLLRYRYGARATKPSRPAPPARPWSASPEPGWDRAWLVPRVPPTHAILPTCNSPGLVLKLDEDFTSDLYNHPLISLPVELSIEDPLPGPKIKFPICHRHNHLVMNHQRLQVRVAII